MKTTFYSIGFTLVIGCNAAMEQASSPQPEIVGIFPSIRPIAIEDSSRYYNAVKDFFETSLVRRNFNGAILVAKGETVLYENYVGYKNPRTKEEPLDANSSMHIASASKNFASTAVLKLAEEGSLRLDQLVSDFFPGFPYPEVTVQMLMSHRSGLPNYVHYLENMGWDKKQYATNQDVLNSLFTMHPPAAFKAGTRFSYSNTNFLLLAMIVEKTTGLSYPDYMKKTFFAPLQMNDTYIFTLADTSTAIPSFKANGGLWKWDFLEATYGDKNIYTTPRDLLKWASALSEGRILNQSLLDSAYKPYSNEKPGVHNYGLGWRLLMLHNGKKVIYHNGRWHGTNAAFARLPEEDVTIIIIGNKYNSNIYNTARKSYDLFGDYQQGGSSSDEEENVAAVRHKSHHHISKKSLAKKSIRRRSTSSSRSVAKNRR